MSTLRTFNLQNPDSGTVNIEMDQGGNTLMTGIATVRGAAHFTSTSGSDAVGIGTDITAYKLDVRVTGAEAGLRVYNPDTSSNASGILRLGNDDNQNAAFLRLNSSNNTSAVGGAGSLVLGHGLSKDLHLSTAGASRLRITSGGNVQVNGGNVHIDDNGEFAIFEGDTSLSMTNSSKISMDFASNIARIRSSHNGSAVSRPLAFFIGGSEKLRIDANGRISVNSNANASDSNEGAQLRVTGTPITRNQYYSPAGDYFGSFGYTDNTYTKSWIAVDSSYNKASAVSSGIFLSAFHSDANGSACGHTIKNTRADGGGLIFSSVTTASSTGNPAVETERLRINSDGRLLINATNNPTLGGQTPYLRVNGGYANLDGLRIRGLDTGNTIWKTGGDMGITVATAHSLRLNTNSATGLQINANGCVTKPLNPSFSANLAGGNLNAANHNNVIIFNNQHFDNSNSYNTSNGRFTAPVAGKYYFGVQIYAGFDFSGVRVLHSKFQKNGNDVASADMFGGSSNHGGTYYHPTGCGHMMIDLAVNDYVTFNSGGFAAGGTGNAVIYAASGTRFFGYLVG